jgi:hypothetical protein
MTQTWPVLAMTSVCLFTAGCGLSSLDLRNDLDFHKASFHDKLAADRALAEEFFACSKQAYDEQMLAPDRNERATDTLAKSRPDGNRLTDGHLSPVHALIQRIKERRQGQADSLHTLEDLLSDWNGGARGRLDLDKLRKVVDVIKQWHDHLDFDEDALAEDPSRFGQLLLAYNKAYFGGVQFAEGKADSGAGIRVAAKMGSEGFTDRNGNVWRFPGGRSDKGGGAETCDRVCSSRLATCQRRLGPSVS